MGVADDVSNDAASALMLPTSVILEAGSSEQSTCTLSANTYFEQATRRFLFTMSNRTSYKFVLSGSRQECGILDAPFKELRVGTRNNPAELCIRGYKKDYALYGVTYTLQFRILEATDKDTNRRLHVYLGVGEATNNCFGWYICTDPELLLSSKKWIRALDSKDGYNRDKRDYEDKVLNRGGKYHLRASYDELQLHIEMITDNESHSTPTMIITQML